MKTLLGTLLTVSIFTGVAFAFSDYKTRFITTATLTIYVKDGRYIVIRNFTQDQAASQRGILVAGVIPPTPTPTPAPTPSPTPTPPYLSTQAGPGVASSTGGTLKDTATLVGFNNPTGTISFSLTGPSPSSAVVDSEGPVTVTRNSDYQTPTGFTTTGATAPGTYTWHAQYSGDVNNPARVDNGDNETVIVTATPTPAPTAAPTPTPIFAGVLTAAIQRPVAALPGQPNPTKEFIKPITIAGPATLTIDPVPGATLAITYKKYLQPIQPTPTRTVTAAKSSTSSTFSTKTSTTTHSGTVSKSIVSDEDEIEWSTPSRTPTPTATPTPTPAPKSRASAATPTATPSVTPTPTPQK